MLTIIGHTQGSAISPDGTTIAYINDLGDIEELGFVHSRGRDNHRVLGTGSSSRIDPGAWSPDGKYIAATGYDPNVQMCNQADVKAGKQNYLASVRAWASTILRALEELPPDRETE